MRSILPRILEVLTAASMPHVPSNGKRTP